MPERTNEEVIRAYLQAIVSNDAATQARLRDPDWFVDYPQSGERIRGHANERAIADHYPGGLPEVDPGRLVGSEDRWVVTPSFTYERIAGSGDTWWGEGRAHYPDGSTWFVASMYRLRDGRVLRETTYWALPFDPPAWRAEWVEPITPD
jgi:SnoaL-like domain